MMSLIQALISEIENESKGTRKTLERVPNDKMDWSPHEKSMSMKALASHIANLGSITAIIANTSLFDFAALKEPLPEFDTAEDLVKAFDKGTQDSIEALKALKDEDLAEKWVMRAGDHLIMNQPKAVAIRIMALNHLYHHRAQLGVYLRLLDIPVPGVYGPSADDV